MSSADTGSSGVGKSLRLNSRDSTNSDSDNVLMRIFVLSYGAGGSVMFEVDYEDLS